MLLLQTNILKLQSSRDSFNNITRVNTTHRSASSRHPPLPIALRLERNNCPHRTMFSLQTATITYCSIAILAFSAGTAFGLDNRNHGLQALGETYSPVSHDEAIESGNAKSDRETMARSTQKAHGLLEPRQKNHNEARALRLNKNKPQTSAANKKSNRTTGTTTSFNKIISNNNNKTTRNKKNKNNINLDNIEFEIDNGLFQKKKNVATKSDSNTAEKMNTRKNDQNNRGESIAKQLANTKVILRPLLVTSTTDSNNKKNNSRAKQTTTTGTVKNSFADNTTNGYPFKYPTIRYVPWTELSIDTRKIMSKTLGYNKSTWDNLGTNMIELKLFRELSLNEQEGWRLLGLDEHVWDCFVNHYISYGKKDQVQINVYDHFTELKVVWSAQWKQLSQEQQLVANQLCWFEEVWDMRALGTW